MNKILEFGKMAMFYVRVLSGYEVRKIRSYRLELQQRLQQAHQKKEALNKIPEQMIISEVRQMVEEMQALNKRLDEAEVEIEKYFKPIDKEAEILMQAQLEGQEQRMKHMIETIQNQALLEKEEAERLANLQNANTDQQPECADKTAHKGGPH